MNPLERRDCMGKLCCRLVSLEIIVKQTHNTCSLMIDPEKDGLFVREEDFVIYLHLVVNSFARPLSPNSDGMIPATRCQGSSIR